jgi:16S rRNA (cytidine1402-2'-O)-methyltransferase
MSSDAFAFFGFPPTRPNDRKRWFERLGEVRGTVVFFEAPHRVRQTLIELRETFGDIPVTIGRELTKIHEELVKGPISAALSRLGSPRGEFTIVADIGQTTDIGRHEPAQVVDSRREALAKFAHGYGLTANELYKAILNARNSCE